MELKRYIFRYSASTSSELSPWPDWLSVSWTTPTRSMLMLQLQLQKSLPNKNLENFFCVVHSSLNFLLYGVQCITREINDVNPEEIPPFVSRAVHNECRLIRRIHFFSEPSQPRCACTFPLLSWAPYSFLHRIFTWTSALSPSFTLGANSNKL